MPPQCPQLQVGKPRHGAARGLHGWHQRIRTRIFFPRYLTDSWRTSFPFLWFSLLLCAHGGRCHVSHFLCRSPLAARVHWAPAPGSTCWAPGSSFLRAQNSLGSIFSDHWASPKANTLCLGPSLRSLLLFGGVAGSLHDSSLLRGSLHKGA